MITHQFSFQNNTWNNAFSENADQFQLVLAFGERDIFESRSVAKELQLFFPAANVVCGTTSGEIMQRSVNDDSISCVAINFEKTELQIALSNIRNFENTYNLGNHVAKQLNKENLNYVLVISDGGKVNGTELTQAISEELGSDVLVTGGLAGDKARFQKTLVGLNDDVQDGNVVLIGMYGNHIKVGHGLKGGWDMFGPERTITKSAANVLFEIDGESALDLYKNYLGNYASELPGSALLFPLAIKANVEDKPLVRTILSIDETTQSMTFAGNMPEGSSVRLMKANFDNLIESAGQAATEASFIQNSKPDLVLLISCVGRKLVLGNRTEEEVESAADNFAENTPIIGFYSYGEISPHQTGTCSDLHNQTMTITTFSEI
jgi:hypothetical protein